LLTVFCPSRLERGSGINLKRPGGEALPGRLD